MWGSRAGAAHGREEQVKANPPWVRPLATFGSAAKGPSLAQRQLLGEEQQAGPGLTELTVLLFLCQISTGLLTSSGRLRLRCTGSCRQWQQHQNCS